MCSTGCLSSDEETVISADMKGLKIDEKESRQRERWVKCLTEGH